MFVANRVRKIASLQKSGFQGNIAGPWQSRKRMEGQEWFTRPEWLLDEDLSPDRLKSDKYQRHL